VYKLLLISVYLCGVSRLISVYFKLLQTAGGILLPEANVAKANEGIVLAVGSGFTARDGTKVTVSVEVGDKVVLPEYGGLPLKVDGEEAFIFRNDEILAKYSN
jgi:chaperonin GroES